MAKVTQHLWFEKEMESAVRCYTTIIPGSSMQWIATIPADTPSGPAGSVKIAAFTIGDQRQPEIDRLWDALKEGGNVEQCGWLRDRWGLCWQITPKRLGELMRDPDRQKAKRVAEAMLKMTKFDIAGLERAAQGPAS